MKAILLASALVMAPLVAVGATVAPGDLMSNIFQLSAGGNASFSYEPTKAVEISIIALSGTGGAGGTDLSKVLFGVGSASTAFSTVNNFGRTSNANGTLASFKTAAPFSLDFTAPGTSNVVNVSYTFAVSDVPVPAAGGLLAGAVAAVGALGRRSRRRVTPPMAA